MSDGYYFFREFPDNWWRAIRVQDGRMTAAWLTGDRDADKYCATCEVRGPLAPDDPDLELALADSMWRLLRPLGSEPVKEQLT